MNLPAPAQWAVSDAIANARAICALLDADPDVEAVKRAFLALRHAAVRGYGLTTEAERETREAAVAQHEGRAA